VQLTSTNSSIGLIYALKKIFYVILMILIFYFITPVYTAGVFFTQN